MKRNAVALAVGALFMAPAAHAQIVFGNDAIGTMQIYGKLYPEVIYAKSSGATTAGATVSTLVSPSGVCGTSASTGRCNGVTSGSRVAVDSQNSYIGFRGERKLGNTGLKGIWQLEQTVEIDGVDDAPFSTRNSFLGLSGGFGTVKLGHMDTIYKEYGQQENIFGITSGNFLSASNVLSQIGVGRSTTARFHERAANSIQYTSPEMGGFEFGLQYSPDETKNDVSSSGAQNRLNAQLWSGGVKYEKGPIYLAVEGEIHKDRFGGSNNVSSALSNIGVAGTDPHSRDTAIRLSGGYKFGSQRIGFDISKLKYTETGQAPGVNKFDTYQHVTWAVGWEMKVGGPWRVAAEYVRGQEGSCKVTVGNCTTEGLTGSLLAGGVAYDLDRQTFLFLIAGQLQNGTAAQYDNWAAANPARGADITQAAVGMQYRF